MNSRERVLAMLEGRPVDHLPCMPIIMQFAGNYIGAKCRDYATDFRVLTEGQPRVAEESGIDHVNTMSDPAGEAADCGAAVKFYADQPPALDEANALLTNFKVLGHTSPGHVRAAGQEFFTPPAETYLLTSIEGSETWLNRFAARLDRESLALARNTFKEVAKILDGRLREYGVQH